MTMACFLEIEREELEKSLDKHLPSPGEYPTRIHEAIRYSTLGGGKRLRPIVALEATRALGFDTSKIRRSACAVEYVHCCSLILDDLPSMDNAVTRRGRDATHRAFGVATAILAADALLMHAFRLVSDDAVGAGASGVRTARAVRELATAVGSFGMVGGQHVDLEAAASATIDLSTLEYIQSHKTGSLFVVAATIGGVILGAPESRLMSLAAYGRNLGLAYQIVDDILDAEGDAEALGKQTGCDAAANKKTFVTVCGAERARAGAADLIRSAHEALAGIGGPSVVLSDIADHCLGRTS